MKRNQSMSWVEILIIDLALILAIGVMGAGKVNEGKTDVAKSRTALTAIASR